MIDRKKFFDTVRKTPFGGKLSSEQVAGMSAILDEWEKREIADKRWLAYMLATTFHETARTMQPIAERGPRQYFDKYEPLTRIGRNLGNKVKGDGYLFRGRGYVQLTGRYNYETMAREVKRNLLHEPDLALLPDVAAEIMFYGMIHGTFTGFSLGHFFSDAKNDPINARRIINGIDRADLVASHYRQFLAALN